MKKIIYLTALVALVSFQACTKEYQIEIDEFDTTAFARFGVEGNPIPDKLTEGYALVRTKSKIMENDLLKYILEDPELEGEVSFFDKYDAKLIDMVMEKENVVTSLTFYNPDNASVIAEFEGRALYSDTLKCHFNGPLITDLGKFTVYAYPGAVQTVSYQSEVTEPDQSITEKIYEVTDSLTYLKSEVHTTVVLHPGEGEDGWSSGAYDLQSEVTRYNSSGVKTKSFFKTFEGTTDLTESLMKLQPKKMKLSGYHEYDENGNQMSMGQMFFQKTSYQIYKTTLYDRYDGQSYFLVFFRGAGPDSGRGALVKANDALTSLTMHHVFNYSFNEQGNMILSNFYRSYRYGDERVKGTKYLVPTVLNTSGRMRLDGNYIDFSSIGATKFNARKWKDENWFRKTVKGYL